MLAALGFVEAIVLGANVAILGGSGEQSQRVHRYENHFWDLETAPRQLLLNQPTERHTRLNNTGSVVCLNASQRSARGEHPQRLRMDEIDEMDLAIFDAAMGQTMQDTLRYKPIETQTVCSSTHQNADGTMTEILKRAAENNWPHYVWCYRESMTVWLTESELARKKAQVTAEMWRVEYDLQEPSIGNRAILTSAVDDMFDKSLGVFEGKSNEYIEVEEPFWACEVGYEEERNGVSVSCVPNFALNTQSHIENDHNSTFIKEVTENITSADLAQDFDHKDSTEGLKARAATLSEAKPFCLAHNRSLFVAQYVTGADWAKEQDWTVIATFRVDVRPKRLVAYLRIGRTNWPIMVSKFDARLARYPGRAIHDATGVGNVVRDYMENRVQGMVLGGRKYYDLLTEYIAAVERGEYKVPHIRHAYTEHKYATMDAIYGSGHLPDTVCAFALANRAARVAPRGFGPA
jgi:hypothetical protein